VGGRFEIPLGNRTARHLVTQREIELRRAATQFRNVEQEVILDVRTAARNMRSATQALEAAERRRIAQEETLRAEKERLRLGDSTPFEVLEFEEDLAEAETQEIRSFQAYLNAIAGIERAQGTLLETRGISLQTELRR
jgi:outer membrane protein TolC